MAVDWPGAQPRRALLSGIVAHAVTIATLLIFTGWALQFRFEAPPVPLIWGASAVALAASFRIGVGAAVTVALAIAAVHLFRGADPLAAALIAAGTGGGGWAGAYLLRRWRFDPAFGRVRDVSVFLAVGSLVGAAFSALAGTLMVVGLNLDTRFGETFGLCWIADTMGMLLLAPVLLSARLPSRIDAESIAWLMSVPLVVFGIYAGGLPEMTALPASYAVFPLIMAVALRRPLPVVALVLLAVSVIAVTCTAIGKGPFVQADMKPNMLALHAHLAMLALTGLLLSAVRAERGAAENRARDHLRMLARAGRISAMSTMAAGIAHEINQPLCAVQSYGQTARRMVKQGAPAEDLDSVLARIVGSTDRAADIVRRMRGFLRGERMRRECQDLNKVVYEAVNLVRPECKLRGTRLELNLADGPLLARVDAVEVEQVVVNLVQNALDSLGRSSPAQVHRWVQVETRSASSQLVDLVVSDGGPGLPDGDPAELFEPLSGGSNGSGLGLPIVRSIVEAHGGEIRAGRAAGGGAEFRVCLPAAHAREWKKRDD